MQTYKFQTTISEQGIISLPSKNLLNGQQVEVIIRQINDNKKLEIKSDKKHLVDNFIKE